MKLSIIVPVYNMVSGGKLDFCIKSLLSQTIEDYEIIAIDDKSTDNSLEVLKNYEKEYPDKVKVIESPNNRRQGGAKNLGLRAATGEWIGFVDSDDWVAPDFYKKMLEKAGQTGADIVGCKYSLKYSQDFEIGNIIENNYSKWEGKMDLAKYKDAILSAGSMVIKIFKRSIFHDNGLWFPEYVFYEDNCTSALTMLYCNKFAYVDEPLYYYYQHGSSTVHHANINKSYDRMKTMEMLLGECYKRGFLEEYPDELEYRFTELYYINTLFSYMQLVPFHRRRISYVRLLRDGIKAYFPEYATNPYFDERQDAETKRLTEMHCKSPFLFFWYYTVLSTYRKIRKKVRK